MNEKDLLQKKKEIDSLKTKISEYKGIESVLLKQLKDDFDCDTIEEAEQKIKDLDSKVKEANEKIEKNTNKLIKKYYNDTDPDTE